jgi:hypothetical protein
LSQAFRSGLAGYSAETLLSNRGNFLASALARFDEAYLFSNEGDEVLRQISTLANYFVSPTKSRNYGFRLGNVEILSSNFGLIDVSEDNFLRTLHRQSDAAADLRYAGGRQMCVAAMSKACCRSS